LPNNKCAPNDSSFPIAFSWCLMQSLLFFKNIWGGDSTRTNDWGGGSSEWQTASAWMNQFPFHAARSNPQYVTSVSIPLRSVGLDWASIKTEMNGALPTCTSIIPISSWIQGFASKVFVELSELRYIEYCMQLFDSINQTGHCMNWSKAWSNCVNSQLYCRYVARKLTDWSRGNLELSFQVRKGSVMVPVCRSPRVSD